MSPVLQQTRRPSGNGVAARVVPRLGRKEQLIEVLVFLFLIVPSMAIDLLLVHQRPDQVGFVIVAVSIILRDLGLAALIFFFLWRNGEPAGRIGWRLRDVWREVLLGVLLYVPFSMVMFGLDGLLLQLGLSQPSAGSQAFLRPHGAGQLVLAGVLVGVVAVTEETIFRGYLLLRLSTVGRSMALAVVLSSLIFSIGHGYEGSAGVATVGVMGIIFAVIYLWRGSLVAPVTIHFLQDFIAIVVLSALAGEPAHTALAGVPHNAAPTARGNVAAHVRRPIIQRPGAEDAYPSCDESVRDREPLESIVAPAMVVVRPVTAGTAGFTSDLPLILKSNNHLWRCGQERRRTARRGPRHPRGRPLRVNHRPQLLPAPKSKALDLLSIPLPAGNHTNPKRKRGLHVLSLACASRWCTMCQSSAGAA